ncbi:MAG: Uncharacterised protein [Opitutia bacterium UBA7350]|nr:MAG: Uncharacterised protein [Opitutae bacterium UBA7350]
MISTEKKFLFIHRPKTAGNSIQSVLMEYSDDEKVVDAKRQDGIDRFELKHLKYTKLKKHSSLTRYCREMDRDTYQKLFKFSVIRNPWELMVSHYFSPHRNVTEWDRVDFYRMIKKMPPLSYYIQNRGLIAHALKRKGIYFETSVPLDNDVDILLRFEYLEDDFMKLCQHLNLGDLVLPKRNESKAKGRNITDYYDQELIDLVAYQFRKEIKFGDYQFPCN